jgi:tetratricopeptide (TPR) repeat protein
MVTGRFADFKLGRRLGGGSFGEVHEAFDRQRQTRVALKRLLVTHSEALYRFKKEFRALAGIFHPNLATLHELFTEGEGWYIAMELVQGVDIVRYVRRDALVAFAPTIEAAMEDDLEPTLAIERGPSGVDYQRLRASLVQLAHGVQALHDAGRVHRDLKPSNVLVNVEGTVKVLDFGLVTELHDGAVGSLVGCVGTPDYMAPEQVRGADVTPSADWYAVGALLYEALTARVPFDGDVDDVLVEKQVRDPEDPRAVRTGLPDDLCDLCMGLLHREPASRLNGRELVERLDARRVHSPRPNSAPPTLVGRDAQLRVLTEALDECRAGATVVVHVSGPSGIGKSALLNAFVSRPEACGSAVVLQGRCYEGDAVPFKAVDTIVDALTARLLRARPEETARIVPRDFGTLTRLFPALQRVEARIQAASFGAAESADPFQVRRRGFAAMREMLGRLGSLHPLVVWIDDLQWGDGDSVALLQELVEPPDAPPLLLLLSYRSEDERTSEVLRAMQSSALGGDVRRVRLGPLKDGDAAVLATTLLSSSGTPAEADVEAIVRESRGDPLFVHELARHAASGVRSTDDVTVDDLIAHRVRQLSAPASSVLAVVSIAASALEVSVLREAAGLSGEELLATLGALKAEHLVRMRRVGRDEAIEAYHDRIRERAYALLEPAVARLWHARLAAIFEAREGTDPEALASHHRAAGNVERAVWHMERAADAAARALAFQRAAQLYELTLTLSAHDPAKRRVLYEQLGNALANAGRGALAAEAFEAATKGASGDHSLELRRRAADQLLRGGHFDRGLEATRAVLVAIRMRLPSTVFGTLIALAFYRARLALRGLHFQERAEAVIPSDERTRIDTCFAVGLTFGLVDIYTGMLFSTRALLLALEAGEIERIGRSIGLEAGFRGGLGGRRSWRRTQRLLAIGRALAERSESALARLFVTVGSGTTLFGNGRYREAVEEFERSLEMARNGVPGLVFESSAVRQLLMVSLGYLGRFKALRRAQEEALRDALARGDVYSSVSMRTGAAVFPSLAEDRPDLAERKIAAALEAWTKQGFHLEHYDGLIGRVYASLYVDDAERAHALAFELLARTRRALFWRVQTIRTRALYYPGASALAMAQRSLADRTVLLREAARQATALERERTAWIHPFALALRAGLAQQLGLRDDALSKLDAAGTEFTIHGMLGYAAAARYHAAALRGDAAQKERAIDHFRSEDVVVPSRMIRTLISGFPE